MHIETAIKGSMEGERASGRPYDGTFFVVYNRTGFTIHNAS